MAGCVNSLETSKYKQWRSEKTTLRDVMRLVDCGKICCRTSMHMLLLRKIEINENIAGSLQYISRR